MTAIEDITTTGTTDTIPTITTTLTATATVTASTPPAQNTPASAPAHSKSHGTPLVRRRIKFPSTTPVSGRWERRSPVLPRLPCTHRAAIYLGRSSRLGLPKGRIQP